MSGRRASSGNSPGPRPFREVIHRRRMPSRSRSPPSQRSSRRDRRRRTGESRRPRESQRASARSRSPRRHREDQPAQPPPQPNPSQELARTMKFWREKIPFPMLCADSVFGVPVQPGDPLADLMTRLKDIWTRGNMVRAAIRVALGSAGQRASSMVPAVTVATDRVAHDPLASCVVLKLHLPQGLGVQSSDQLVTMMACMNEVVTGEGGPEGDAPECAMLPVINGGILEAVWCLVSGRKRFVVKEHHKTALTACVARIYYRQRNCPWDTCNLQQVSTGTGKAVQLALFPSLFQGLCGMARQNPDKYSTVVVLDSKHCPITSLSRLCVQLSKCSLDKYRECLEACRETVDAMTSGSVPWCSALGPSWSSLFEVTPVTPATSADPAAVRRQLRRDLDVSDTESSSSSSSSSSEDDGGECEDGEILEGPKTSLSVETVSEIDINPPVESVPQEEPAEPAVVEVSLVESPLAPHDVGAERMEGESSTEQPTEEPVQEAAAAQVADDEVDIYEDLDTGGSAERAAEAAIRQMMFSDEDEPDNGQNNRDVVAPGSMMTLTVAQQAPATPED